MHNAYLLTILIRMKLVFDYLNVSKCIKHRQDLDQELDNSSRVNFASGNIMETGRISRHDAECESLSFNESSTK